MSSRSIDYSDSNGFPPSGGEAEPNGAAPRSQGALVPLRRTEPTLPTSFSPPSAPTVPGSAIDQKTVLAAVRRRWLVASVLGLLGGLLGAGASWVLVPVEYTTHAELRIKSAILTPLGAAREGNTTFDIYRTTLTRLIRGPLVLRAALRQDKIAELETIKSAADPFDYLEKKLTVLAPSPEFIRVSLTGEHQEEVHQIVNAVVDVFVKEVYARDKTERQAQLSEVDEARAQVRGKLNEKRRQKERLATRISGNTDASFLEMQLVKEQFYNELRKQLVTAQIERTRVEVELQLRDPNRETSEETLDERTLQKLLAARPEVVAAENSLNGLRGNLAELKLRQGSGSKRVVAVEAEVTEAEQKLEELKESLKETVSKQVKELEEESETTSLSQLKRKKEMLNSEIEHLERLMNRETESRATSVGFAIEMEELNKEIKQMEDFQTKLVDEGEKIRLLINSQPRVEKFRDAFIPVVPDIGKKLIITGGAGLGLFGLIFCGILFLDVRMRRINSLDEIVSGLKLPVLGSLPLIPSRKRGGLSSGATAAENRWKGALIESVDSARVMLLRRASLENAKAVMIGSAMTSEGKTTLSCHLATSLARAGYRTVLVDADLRRPTIQRVFELPAEPGLCEVLTGSADPAAVILPTRQDGLYVVPAGLLTGEALRQLAQGGMSGLMERLRSEFDFIILDSSPLLPVTDGLMLSQYVDGVIVSVRRDVSQYPKVSAACNKLQMMGTPIWGALVIGVDQSPYGYRYSYGARYGYGYGVSPGQREDAGSEGPMMVDPAPEQP